MKFKNKDALIIAKKFNINLDIVPLEILKYGINVELEHGTKIDKSNITNNDLIMTGKIALAHLIEFPDYYQRLKKMEDKAELYWKGKKKPNIFLK